MGGGKPEYYKSMGEPQKKGGGSNFEISVGGSKNRGEGDTIFDSNLVGGNLGGNYGVWHQQYVLYGYFQTKDEIFAMGEKLSCFYVEVNYWFLGDST